MGKTFEMPDGSEITVHNQIIRCPELMFRPIMNHLEVKGLHELVHKTSMDCEEDVQKKVAESVKVKVTAPPERRVSAWIGGSILSSLEQFQAMWITKEEFVEHGVNIVNRNCF